MRILGPGDDDTVNQNEKQEFEGKIKCPLAGDITKNKADVVNKCNSNKELMNHVGAPHELNRRPRGLRATFIMNKEKVK